MNSECPFRILVVKSEKRVNLSGWAAVPRWGVQIEEKEVLQWKNPNGEWIDVPKEEMFIKLKNPKEERKDLHNKLSEVAQRVAKLRERLANGEEWMNHPADGVYGRFLDSERAEMEDAPSQDGYHYYRNQGGAGARVARFKRDENQCSIKYFADFLCPEASIFKQRDHID